ncbi:hypothetical protein ACU8KH_01788 [Lachancea thermotolerans]
MRSWKVWDAFLVPFEYSQSFVGSRDSIRCVGTCERLMFLTNCQRCMHWMRSFSLDDLRVLDNFYGMIVFERLRPEKLGARKASSDV